jgi:hypothetical protein
MPDLDRVSRDLLIRTVIGESDDQPALGQAAVAHVALNRLASGKYGKTMPDVLFAKGQWEPWDTRSNELINIPVNSDRYQRTAQIVDGVLGGKIPDPTQGMTHFLEPNIVMQRSGRLPDWASGRGLRIGSHVFYAPEGRVMPQEDLLGEWLPKEAKPSQKTVPTSNASPTAEGNALRLTVHPDPSNIQGQEEDLSSEWAPPEKASPEIAAKDRTPPPQAVANPPSDHERLSELTNRLIREHQDIGPMDTAIRAGAGVIRGAGNIADTLAQGITSGSERATNFLQHLNVVSPDTAKAVADWHARVNEDIAANRAGYEEARPGVAGHLGELGGEIAGTGPFLRAGGAALRALPGAGRVAAFGAQHPLLGAAAAGATTGAGINALTSAARPDVPLSEQLGTGAAFGSVLGPIGYGVGRLFRGGVDRETADLADKAMSKYGIPLRADQISGNETIRRAGALGAKIPGSGFASNVGEQQAAVNRAVANTFGETADKVTKGVWSRAKDRIGNVFDQTLPNLEAHINPNVASKIQAISDATEYLPQEEARIVNKHVNDVLHQFIDVGGGRMEGKQIQALISKGSPLDRAIAGGSSNVKYLASELKDVLFDAVGQTASGSARTDPAYLQNLRAFQNARYQYKNLKTVEGLVKKSPTGDISPALLQSAVGKSFKNAASGGGGDLAEIADIGQRFLKPPGTSGTAEHLALMKLGLTAAGGLGGIAAFDPEHFQRDAAVLGAALTAGRLGGAALTSRALARSAVKSGQRTSPSQLGAALTAGLPGLAPRESPLRVTVHPDSPSAP